MEKKNEIEEIVKLVREIAEKNIATVRRMSEYVNWYDDYSFIEPEEKLTRIKNWLQGLKEGLEYGR